MKQPGIISKYNSKLVPLLTVLMLFSIALIGIIVLHLIVYQRKTWDGNGIKVFLNNTRASCAVSGYSHDELIVTYREDWMKSLKEDVLLNNISLPGTHQSLSFYGGDIVKTQVNDFMDQLLSGIRVFDVRCRLYRNRFLIHHGVVYQHRDFGEVLGIMNRFLTTYPTEVLLMRVMEAHTPAYSNLTFEQVFVNYKRTNGHRFWTPVNSAITLGSVRGKIIILQDFSACILYGLDYRSAMFNIQDYYHLNTNWDLYSKWQSVKRQLNDTNYRNNSGTYFMNYLSGSFGSFPYFVASGHSSPGTCDPRLLTGFTTPGFKSWYPDFPRVGCIIGICSIAYEGTNILTTNYIRQHNLSFVGIIMSDFPGDALINAIINLNLR